MLQEIYIDRDRKYVRMYAPDRVKYRWISDNIDDPTNLSNTYTIAIEGDGVRGKIIFPKDDVIITVFG